MRFQLCLFTAVATVSGSLMVAGPVASASTFPAPVNGAIAAYPLGSEGGGLSVIDPTSGESHEIVPEGQDYNDGEPVWSADGTQFAYLRNYFRGEGDGSAIRIASANGTGREVVRVPQDLDDLTWSPDGSRFAFTVFGSAATNVQTNVYTVRADGTDWRMLSNPDYSEYGSFDPSWSPDGGLVAFTRVDDVFVVRPDGSGETQITNECRYPSDNNVEPGGCDLDGDAIRRDNWESNWHPSGNRLIVRVFEYNGRDAAEEFLGSLPVTPNSRAVEIPNTRDASGGVYSPDGSKIAFNAPGPSSNPGTDLYVADADGSNRSPSLGSFFDPDWQPCPSGECPVFTEPEPCEVSVAVPPTSVSLELPSGPVTASFADVQGSGMFTASECADGGTDGQIFAHYDLSHTGFTFSTAELCLPYDEQAAADLGYREQDIQQFHTLPDGTRKVITTSRDTDANTVCGLTSSFSPFTVGIGAVNRTITNACPPDRVPEDGFTDVPDSNPHEPSIDCLVWWQIARGTGDGSTYNPERDINRANMATLVAELVRRAGADLPQGEDAFSDDNGNTHEANINALANAGIVRGTSTPGSYNPNGDVKRAQMATYLINAATYITRTTPTTNIDFFTDDDDQPTHQHNINLVAATGITAGSNTGPAHYTPQGNVNRAQIATFLTRLLDQLITDGHTPPHN